MNGGDDRVIFQFSTVGLTELIEMSAGEFEPARERVAADYGGELEHAVAE